MTTKNVTNSNENGKYKNKGKLHIFSINNTKITLVNHQCSMFKYVDMNDILAF